MTRQINGDPAELGQRQGFKNSAPENGETARGEGQSNESSPSRVPGEAGEETNSENSAPAPRVPSLGTAHTAQRAPGDSESPEMIQTRPAAAGLAKQATNDQEQTLMEVVAELEAMGELDPETKRQLIADLRETKPELWQPMLSIYRLALSKHKQGMTPSPGLPSTQAIVSDDDPHLQTSPEVSPAIPAANTALASQSSLGIRHPPATRSIETIPPAEQLGSRPSPLRPATGATATIQSIEPEQSSYEVQPAQYQTAADEYVSEPSLPLRQRDRAVHPATASSAEKSLARQARPPAGMKSDRRDAEVASREEELADWQAYLKEAILLLEEETSGPARTAEEVRRQAELRLLYLAGGDREAALRPIDGISTTQQEFWSESLFALSTYLDAETLPDGPRRAAEARRHLEAAVTRLGELSTLSVRNIAFCSKVNSYGIYETYPADVFAPGQQVLLYAELENFKCTETQAGFVTAVRSSYQIFDARGVRVESHDFATTEETCRNRRRDFFMRYFIDLPERIYDGEYTLKITIEDMQGQTSGEATIPFTIKEHKK